MSRTIETTHQLAAAVHDPASQVVYAGSGRRLSAQQLDAQYRRLAEKESRERAQAEVDRAEAELRDALECWRDMPSVPPVEQYAAAAHPQPFVFTEPAPAAPNLQHERECLADEQRRRAEVAERPGFAGRCAPWAVGV